MMHKAKVFATIVTIVALSSSAFADVVGKWKGQMEVSTEKGSKVATNGSIKMPSLTLELKADKTYKGTQGNSPDGKEHVAEGKWSLSGNTLTLTPTKRDGKAATGEGAKPRIYTLSKDGKTLTLDLSGVVQSAAKSQAGGKEIGKVTAKMVLRKA